MLCGRVAQDDDLRGSLSVAANGNQGRRVAVAEALRSEALAVARLAVDFLVRAIARQNRIQWSVAVAAAEAHFVKLLVST